MMEFQALEHNERTCVCVYRVCVVCVGECVWCVCSVGVYMVSVV